MSENYNATGEIKEIGILDMMNGAIGERAAYELSRIMKNCRDLNTEAKKARTLTIKLSIVPTENRDSVAVRAAVESKLVPVKPIDGALLLGGTMAQMRNPSLWSTRRRCPVSGTSTAANRTSRKSSSWKTSSRRKGERT